MVVCQRVSDKIGIGVERSDPMGYGPCETQHRLGHSDIGHSQLQKHQFGMVYEIGFTDQE